VAQRLARMALRVEPEILVQLLEPMPDQRHFLRRKAQRLAGPQAGVDSDPDDLVSLADRNHDQIERHAAMHARLALGLGHQRHTAALLEIAHRAEAAALVGRRSRDAEDAERLGRRFVRPLDVIAEQGHGPVREPFEQRPALGIGDPGGVAAHLVLQRVPVAHRQPDVVQHPAQIGRELLPAARVGAVELEVHHGLAPALVGADLRDIAEDAVLVARNAHHRVEQAIDPELVRGDRVGDGVDQERHVVVDDRHPHPALARLAAGRLDLQRQLAPLPLRRDLGEELRRLALRLPIEIVGFAGQCVLRQRLANRIDQRLGQAHVGSHEKGGSASISDAPGL